jgi:recombination protein RecT
MATGNSLAERANGALASKQTFSAFLTSDAVRRKINEMIGGKNGERFITAMISAVSVNPALAECDHSTILSAAMLGEALKLSPSPQLGQYYLVPFKDNRNNRTVATFQLGYRGYLQLAMRSGIYKTINVEAIKEGELVKYDPIFGVFEADAIRDPIERAAAETTGYFAMFEYQNGFRKTLYWPKAQMEAHALQYSQGYKTDVQKGTKYTFWAKDFDAMALKTMLRQIISKWGLMSIDIQQAFESDMSFADAAGGVTYVDDGAIDAGSLPYAGVPKEGQEAAPAAAGSGLASQGEPDWMKEG